MPKLPNSYSISEIADILGVSTQTLRRWEQRGAINPRRTLGNQRRYNEQDLQLLKQHLKKEIPYPPRPKDTLISKDQVATAMGVDKTTVDRWNQAGKISPIGSLMGENLYHKDQITKTPGINETKIESVPAPHEVATAELQAKRIIAKNAKKIDPRLVYGSLGIGAVVFFLVLLLSRVLDLNPFPERSSEAVSLDSGLDSSIGTVSPSGDDIGYFLDGTISIGINSGSLTSLDQNGNLNLNKGIVNSQGAAINGDLVLSGSLYLIPHNPPENPQVGSVYMDDETKTLSYFNGSEWVNLDSSTSGASLQSAYEGGSFITTKEESLVFTLADTVGADADFQINLQGDTSILEVTGTTGELLLTLNPQASVPIQLSQPTQVSNSLYASAFYDYDGNSYYLDPASTTTSLLTAGQIEAGTTFKFTKNGAILSNDNSDYITSSKGLAVGGATDWYFTSAGFLRFQNGVVTNDLEIEGTLNADGKVELGDGGETVTIDSSTWDISTAGAASGFTGITSSGAIVFSGLDCTGNDNGGAITAGAGGTLSCTDDDDSGGAGVWTDGGTVTYLTSTTDDLAIGSTTLVAPFSVDESTNTVRIGEGSGSDGSIDLYSSGGDTGSLTYNTSDQFAFSGGDIVFSGSLSDSDSDVFISDNLDPASDATYDLGDTTTSWRDLYLTGQICFDDSDCASSTSEFSGPWTYSAPNIYADNTTDRLALGTTTTSEMISRLFVTTPVASPIGTALAIFDQTESQDILAASASGTTRLALTNTGTLQTGDLLLGLNDTSATIGTVDSENLTLAPTGNLIVNSTGDVLDIDDPTINLASQATDIELADNTASALTISQGSNNYLLITTTNDNEVFSLDLPAGGATSLTGNLFTSNIAKTINLGTGTATDTINIGTGGTSADDINIGGLATSTIDILGVTDIGDGGSTNYATFNATGDLTFTGSADTITGPGAGGFTITNNSGDLAISTVGSGELDLTSAGLIDVNAGANLDVDITGTYDLLASSTFSIDGTGASNVSATSGNLTLSTITSGDLIINSAAIVDIDAVTEIQIDGALTDIGGGTYTLADGDNDLGVAGDIEALGNIGIDNQGDLRLYEGDAGGINYTGFQAPATLSGDLLMTLPDNAGSAGYALTTNGSGVLSWADVTDSDAGPWSHGDHYLYPDHYWQDDIIVGGNATSSADIQLFSDGSAIFNDQGNDANFIIEGNNDDFLLFADGGLDTITIGSNASLGKLAVDGDADEIQLLIQGNASQTTDLLVLEQSDGTTNVLTVSNAGLLSAGDLTLGLNDASATIATQDTNEDLTINPNGTGDLYLHGSTYQLSDTGDLTLGGRITFENAEYLSNETDDLFIFQGSGGADDTNLYLDLDGTYPVLYSNTDTAVGIDDHLDVTGVSTFGDGSALNTNQTMIVDRNFTIGSGQSGYQLHILGNFFEATSGTHGTIAPLAIDAINVNDGGGTEAVTNLASLYIAGAPTAGTTPANGPYAIFVDAGDVRFDGNLNVRGGTITLDNATDIDIDDAIASSLTISEGSNNYLAINTSNGTEAMQFGNATTNPSFSFLGSGTIAAAGVIDINGGGTSDIAGTLNLSGNTLASSGDLTIDPTGGGVKIGTGTPGTIDLAGDDLYVTQDLEVDGTIYGSLEGTVDLNFTQGSIVFIDSTGSLAQDNANFFFDDDNDLVGFGTNVPESQLHLSASYSDHAALIIDQLNSGNILSASASGTTRLVIDNGGKIGVGDTTPEHMLDIDGFYAGNALVSLNETGGNDIFTASASSTPVFTIGNTGGVRLAPTSTGSVLDFELEDQWTAGDLMNADFASSTTLTGDVIGLDLNLNTNVTGVADGDLTGINLQTPALTSSGTTTTNYYGNRISAAGTLDTTAAESLVTSINWYGNFIQMPNIDSGEAGDTVTAYGIYLNPGTITDGLGTENLYGIWSEGGDWILDDDGDGLLGGTTGDLFLGEDQDLALYHNGTDSFVLSATNDLFLAADDDSAGSQIQFGLEDGSTVLGYFITGTTNTGDFGVDTDTFYVDASANGVGIGTASPGNKLHLYADGSSDIASADGSLLIIEQDGAGDAGIQFELTGGQIWSIGVDNSSTNDDFAIFDGGTNRFTIDGLVGNIGIGTSTPDHKVEVEGFYGGNALMSLNNTGGTDIFTASASSVTRFIIQTDGSTVAPKFVDLANSAYYLDPAASGTSLSLAGNILNDGAFEINSTGGQITIDVDTASVCIRDSTGCDGKLDAGTVDPPYTINGENFATFMSAMTGVKEETTGVVSTNEYVPGVGYRKVIDFTDQSKASDLWLFAKTTDLKEHIDDLVVLLSPAGQTEAWHELDTKNYKLAIYTSIPTRVSYRLTAPRFDADKWSNVRDDGVGGFKITDSDVWEINEDGDVFGVSVSVDDIVIEEGEDGFNLFDAYGNLIERIASYSQAVIANLRTGIIDTQSLLARVITVSGESAKIVSPLVETEKLETDIISPLSSKDIVIDLTYPDEPSGKLAIEGNLDVSQDATVSGTLYAGRIENGQILGLSSSNENLTREQASQSARLAYLEGIQNQQTTNNNTTNDNFDDGALPQATYEGETYEMADETKLIIEDLASKHASISALLAGGVFDYTSASASGDLASTYLEGLTLNSLNARTGVISDLLVVPGQALINNLAVADTLVVRNNLLLTDSSISTLSDTLYLQPAGGSINLAASTLVVRDDGTIDINADVLLAGNLDVQGAIKIEPDGGSSGFAPIIAANNNLDLEINLATDSALVVKAGVDDPVARISASGSAEFRDLTLSAKSSGKTTILTGTKTAIVNTNSLASTSKVFLTFESDYKPATKYWITKDVTNKAFTIHLDYAVNNNTVASWIVIN